MDGMMTDTSPYTSEECMDGIMTDISSHPNGDDSHYHRNVLYSIHKISNVIINSSEYCTVNSEPQINVQFHDAHDADY